MNIQRADYPRYGGRGIKICDRWQNSFNNFLEDMGPTFKNGLSLDRIDNDGNYEPSNCRWATNKEQQNNKRTNRLITINGITKNLTQWIDETHLKRSTVYMRYYAYKWPVKKALGMGN